MCQCAECLWPLMIGYMRSEGMEVKKVMKSNVKVGSWMY